MDSLKCPWQSEDSSQTQFRFSPAMMISYPQECLCIDLYTTARPSSYLISRSRRKFDVDNVSKRNGSSVLLRVFDYRCILSKWQSGNASMLTTWLLQGKESLGAYLHRPPQPA